MSHSPFVSIYAFIYMVLFSHFLKIPSSHNIPPLALPEATPTKIVRSSSITTPPDRNYWIIPSTQN